MSSLNIKMNKARVTPMAITKPFQEQTQDTQFIMDQSDNNSGPEVGIASIASKTWSTLIQVQRSKKVHKRWRNLTNTVRNTVKFTKVFEEINYSLMRDRNKAVSNEKLSDQCILEHENSVEKSRTKTIIERENVSNQERKNWLIRYFITISKMTNVEERKIDFDYIENMLSAGADINSVDKHGQCVLHEIARIWHTDIAKFFIEKGSVVNHPDLYGRTPLHVACGVDYPEMVEFLLNNGADITARTYEENQTPIHYAAKNDASDSLTVLLRHGAEMNDLDFKGRTPLQLAAELDRSTTAELLIEKGAHAGVYDESKLAALVVMIQKMPKIALKALDQFYSTNRANRKQFFYLNFLVPPTEAKKCAAKSPLEVAVEYKQYQLLLHPVFQRLIEVKWQRMGMLGAWFYTVLNFMTTVLWTARICILPVNQDEIYKYPGNGSLKIGLIIVDFIAIATVIFLIVGETREYFIAKKRNTMYKQWRETELQRDLKFAHPRWPEERAYLEREIRSVEEYQSPYIKDYWNYLDWTTQFFMSATIVSHLVNFKIRTDASNETMRFIASVCMTFMWIRLLKYARPFKALGLFVVMLSHVVVDTLKILFLVLHVLIPYVGAFWILFGVYGVDGYTFKNAEIFYSIFQIGVVGDFGFDALKSHSPSVSMVLVGSFIFIGGIVCLNLFIALLSDTFQRVYDNARATAEMQRASIINEIEADVSENKRREYNAWITRNCAPECLYYDDDLIEEENGELRKLTQQIRARVDEIHELVDDNKNGYQGIEHNYDAQNTKLQSSNGLNVSQRSLRSPRGKGQKNNIGLADVNETKMIINILNELKTEYNKSMIQTRAEIAGIGLMLKDLIDDNNKRKRQRRKQSKAPLNLPEIGRKTNAVFEPKVITDNTNDVKQEELRIETITHEHAQEPTATSLENEGFFEGYTFSEQINLESNERLINQTWGTIFKSTTDKEPKKETVDEQQAREKEIDERRSEQECLQNKFSVESVNDNKTNNKHSIRNNQSLDDILQQQFQKQQERHK